MLKSLHIENIAVIESADIDLSEGFNVLTGETGAGKSIIIDSLNAVLGERTSKELIRNGESKAEVSALFCGLSHSALDKLSELGYSTDDDSLLISKSLNTSGGSTIKINGKPATASILKEISKHLINIHGQHDNQGLLNPENHYLYIDRLAENKALLDDYYAEFKNLNSIRKQLNATDMDEDEKRRNIELLTFQIKELSDADIKIGEANSLKQKLEVARNLEKSISNLSNAYAFLSGGDQSDGAISLLQNAGNLLNNTDLEDTKQKLFEVLSITDDIGTNIRTKLAELENSSVNAEEIGDRLDFLYRLMLKYGDSEEKLLDYLDNSKQKLDAITLSDKKAIELEKELDKATERLIDKAARLSASRKKTAELFSRQVSEKLKYLDMPNVTFTVSIESGRYTKLGCDTIEFKIGTNIGETVKSLHKIASGGELSRIMLAIKSVLADKDDVDTLVFDEVDTGISGNAAGKVGRMLKDVSISRQVISVTHLAQISSFADTHFKISKDVKDMRTYTMVESLNYEERIKEIARIMSGNDLTENLYNTAKELLDGGLSYGNL